LHSLLEWCRHLVEARQKGYVTTLFGRRCWVKGINDRNPSGKTAATAFASSGEPS
jgi:DNA polymerase I-like protein with 3'-5' exonuclease and polymerase domains